MCLCFWRKKRRTVADKDCHAWPSERGGFWKHVCAWQVHCMHLQLLIRRKHARFHQNTGSWKICGIKNNNNKKNGVENIRFFLKKYSSPDWGWNNLFFLTLFSLRKATTLGVSQNTVWQHRNLQFCFLIWSFFLKFFAAFDSDLFAIVISQNSARNWREH